MDYLRDYIPFYTASTNKLTYAKKDLLKDTPREG